LTDKRLSQRLGEDQFEPLTIEREKELADKLRKAKTKKQKQAIRDTLILSHLRLVVHIGKGYENRLPYDEIMSVGVLALSNAAERWNPDKGSIYQWARRWITTALTKAVDAARPIRVPEAVANEAALIALAIAHQEARLGRRLTAAERAIIVGGKPTFDTLPTVSKSLDQPLAEDEGSGDPTRAATFDELLEDQNAVDPEEYVEQAERVERLRTALGELDDVEREVVLIRFGFTNEKRLTLAALGKKHGVSAEAMRRIEMSAIAKLRHPAMPVDLDGLV
jgi:RNA polymerase primary sigma factor